MSRVISHSPRNLHGKLCDGEFYAKPFLGDLSVTGKKVLSHSFMKNTSHNGSECYMSFPALLQTKIMASYRQIKGNVGVKKTAQPLFEIQQFQSLSSCFFTSRSLPGPLRTFSSISFCFSHWKEKKKKKPNRNSMAKGDAVEQSPPCQLAISVWILLNLWMAL